MRSIKRPRKQVRRYKSLLFPGIAVLAVFLFWAAFAPAEKGEQREFEKDGLRLEITCVDHVGGFLLNFNTSQKINEPYDTYYVYPGAKVTVLEAPPTENGMARWEFRVLGSGTPDREPLELKEGMDPVRLLEEGSFQIYDLERGLAVLEFDVSESGGDHWK